MVKSEAKKLLFYSQNWGGRTVTLFVPYKMKSYIQPFERILALRELAVLGKQEPILASKSDNIYFAPKNIPVSQLAYWEKVADYPTGQALREATVNVIRNGVSLKQLREQFPLTKTAPLPNRRCLRYGTHGIHEYRGKFFPQLVRALLNIAQIPQGGTVLDPMCGSGTALVEASLMGYVVVGVDLNPLSVFMSRVKCQMLSCSLDILEQEYERVRRNLMDSSRQGNLKKSWFFSLPVRDQEYLRSWFATHVLADLDAIMEQVQSVSDPTVRDYMLVSVSNILRRVSWQKEEDLRVRKEIRPDADIDAIKEFLEELGRSARLIMAFRLQEFSLKPEKAEVLEGDARVLSSLLSQWKGKIDCIVTSPPYAMALPYLDTDRLSLIYLGLLSRPEHRKRDLDMIGNREITEKNRRELWDFFVKQKFLLPGSVVNLIEEVDNLYKKSVVGFRRRNLSALLGKYFIDMQQVLVEMHTLLKPGAPAYIVIGNNHTSLQGKRIRINTAALLADVAELVGFRVEELLSMDMLTPRDIFKKNSIDSEYILFLRRQ